MNPEDLAALCIWSEAANQPPEGRRAVAVVMLKRMAQKYRSDGTVIGTVLAKDQFSGFWFEMDNGVYTRVSRTLADAEEKARAMLVQARRDPAMWADCQVAWAECAPKNGIPGGGCAYNAPEHPQFQKLVAEPWAVMYVNLDISKPAWAKPELEVCSIYDHTFFRPT